MKRLIIRH